MQYRTSLHGSSLVALGGCLTLVTAGSACRSAEKFPGGHAKPSEHAIHSSSLEEWMAELHNQVVDQLSSNLEGAQNEASGYRAVAEAARSLESSSKQLQHRATHLRLNQADQDRFLMLAGRMADEARQLGDYAAGENPDLETAEKYYDRILIICNDCHAGFRVLPRLPAQRHASR